MTRRRKAPTKTELLQLQKLYKTDEKIGERLGGVQPYLVAYWRRKKGVPKHSLPKFSEIEIKNLWERFGDDEKAGLELGLSKAAFYNWRRRYGIKEKPAFLKLEQLEFNFPGARIGSTVNSLYGKQTVVQKIIARNAKGERDRVEIGETVEIEPDIVISHFDTPRIVADYRKVGGEYVWNPGKIIVGLDSPGGNPKGPITDLKITREFLKRQRIKSVYDFREGIFHQVVFEKAHALPGQLVLGTDDATISYGCVGMYASSIKTDAMANVWASGKYRMTVPESIRIGIGGRKGRSVFATDIMLAIIKRLKVDGVSDRVIEYGGSIVSQMTMSERFLISNLSVELGAHSAICPYDATTRRFLTGRSGLSYKPVIPDKNAEYIDSYQIGVDQLSPKIAKVSNLDEIKTVTEVENTPVQVVILGSLTNGRYEDIRVAAEILKGKKVHDDCRMVVIPASRAVYLEALNKGLVRVLIEAGAVIVPAGNAGVFSLSELIGRGETCLATLSTRSFIDPGETNAEIFLCSPATAAASALHGAITDPTRFLR